MGRATECIDKSGRGSGEFETITIEVLPDVMASLRRLAAKSELPVETVAGLHLQLAILPHLEMEAGGD